MIRCCNLWTVLAGWAAALAVPASAEDAWLEWIGDVPGGSHYSTIRDLSFDGQVAVGSSDYNGFFPVALLWTRAGGIQVLDPNFVYLQSQAVAVSDDGTAVAGLLTLRQPQHVLAFRWTPEEGIRILGDLPGGARQSFGMGISGDGQVVVGRSASDRADDVESFLWTPALGMVGLGAQTGFQTLAPAAGPWFGTAYGVSRDGSVVVDLSIDQGGCLATSRPMRPADPAYVVHGVTHVCVPNLPSLVARTASKALVNALLPSLRELAADPAAALRNDPVLASGVGIYRGEPVHPHVAAALGVPARSLGALLAEEA